MRSLVVIESPYAGDVQSNITYAKRCVRDSLSRGESPYASHLFFTQPGLLDGTSPEERSLGIECGLAWTTAASMHAVYIDLGISGGMKTGIRRALMNKKRVEFRALDRELTPDDASPVLALLQEFCQTVEYVMPRPLAHTPNVHNVKCWTDYFQAVAHGDKTFEVRKNDRNYKVGDLLVLDEWDPVSGQYTNSRPLSFLITYVLVGGSFGVDPDYCVLGLRAGLLR